MPNPARPFLTAQWRMLAMLNFAIDPAVLAPHVPAGTELDDWNGVHYVSVVGFRFLNTRVMGWPIPWHANFDEVNLRFYVKRRVDDEVRRGVVFIKEIVPRRAIAWVARRGYNENYVALPMRHEVRVPGGENGGGLARYGWRYRGRWHELEATFAGDPVEPAEASGGRFITEHYWGYARQRDGGTLEYRVEHPPWRVWSANGARLHIDTEAIYGTEFAAALSRPPASAFVAEGSAVIVGRGVAI